MRKVLVAALVIFALAFAIGFTTADQAQAANCWYQCGCNGVPYYCCQTPFGTSCKVAKNSPIQCPQIADC